MFCYFGHHKCATQWIAQICYQVAKYSKLEFEYLDYFASPNPNLGQYTQQRQTGFLAYANAHPEQVATLKRFKAFHVIRDPRDLIISAYFSHKKTHHTENWPELEAHRAQLNRVSMEDGLFLEIDFCKSLMTNSIEVGLLSSIQQWNYAQDNILELKFEEITQDPFTVFAKAFEFLGLLTGDAGQTFLHLCLDRLNFARLSGGRSQGKEDTSSHYRKGSAGDWQQYFTRAHLDYFESSCGNLVKKLGYE